MSSTEAVGNALCTLCGKEDWKYVCPRCNTRYCSLDCFKCKVHEKCSEEFYKEQVLNELKHMSGTNEDKQEMIQLLRRAHSDNCDSFDDNDNNITTRLGEVDLEDSDAIWEKLTAKERTMFQDAMTRGDVHFLPKWSPWWMRKTGHIARIEELPTDDERHNNSNRSAGDKKRNPPLPKVEKQISKMEDLLGVGKSPDTNAKYCLLEVLLTYTCIERVFNGDLYDSPNESTSLLLHLSKVLSEKQMYSDLDSCIHCFLSTVSTSEDLHIDVVRTCLLDLHAVMTRSHAGGWFVLRALSHLHGFLKKCCRYMKKNNEGELARKLFTVSKKVYFYLVYSSTRENEVKLLAGDVWRLRQQLLVDEHILNEQKQQIEENYHKLKPTPSGKLIEEI